MEARRVLGTPEKRTTAPSWSASMIAIGPNGAQPSARCLAAGASSNGRGILAKTSMSRNAKSSFSSKIVAPCLVRLIASTGSGTTGATVALRAADRGQKPRARDIVRSKLKVCMAARSAPVRTKWKGNNVMYTLAQSIANGKLGSRGRIAQLHAAKDGRLAAGHTPQRRTEGSPATAPKRSTPSASAPPRPAAHSLWTTRFSLNSEKNMAIADAATTTATI
mmetsp:Transcript_14285/g.40599  ORF Transcript_14285/g.40599 Transcript_14285/m.40599 type:complete len:221 (+) Transcript_14285:940-1602(+)